MVFFFCAPPLAGLCPQSDKIIPPTASTYPVIPTSLPVSEMYATVLSKEDSASNSVGEREKVPYSLLNTCVASPAMVDVSPHDPIVMVCVYINMFGDRPTRPAPSNCSINGPVNSFLLMVSNNMLDITTIKYNTEVC